MENPLESFSKLTDPRIDRKKLHQLNDIIFLTIAAVLSGANTWVDIENYGNAKLEWLRKYIPLKNGIPSHDTLGLLYSRLNAEKFEECFIDWVCACSGITEDVIAIDGKTLRGSYDRANNKAAIHMISAWATQQGLALGQLKTNEKSNEITAIPKLLNVLELKGCIVSIDAMGCQKSIAEDIINQGADYILALKGNQGEFHEQVKHLFKIQSADSEYENIGSDHGRVESRKCKVIKNLQWLDEKEDWKNLTSIIKIESDRYIKITGKTTQEERYYISSLDFDAKQFGQDIRSHWAIENSLHWVLDVVFNEDKSRVRKGNADENLSIIKRTALNLLKMETSTKLSIRNKRFKAGWDNNYLAQVLKLVHNKNE